MENKKKLGTGAIVALTIILLLNLLWIISMVIVMAKTGFVSAWNIASIVIWAAAVFYVLFEYKKPHGNLFRYIMLAYACVVAVMLLLNFNNQQMYVNVVYLAIIILSVYMAGRLNKYKQNIIISGIMFILNGVTPYSLFHAVISAGGKLNFVTAMCFAGSVIVWLAIATSYIIRYKPHKEAGLADKN